MMKNFKKVLSVALCVAVLATMFVVPVSAEGLGYHKNNLPGNVILQDNFNTKTVGSNFAAMDRIGGENGFMVVQTADNGSFVKEDDDTYYKITPDTNPAKTAGGSANGITYDLNQLRIYPEHPDDKGSAGAGKYADWTDGPLTGDWVTEFNFRIPDLSMYYYDGNGDGVVDSNSAQNAVQQLFHAEFCGTATNADGKEIVGVTSRGATVYVSPDGKIRANNTNCGVLKPNTWYTLKVVCHMDRMTYDAYLNGKVFKNSSDGSLHEINMLGGVSNYNTTYPNQNSAFNRALWIKTSRELHIDDYKVYKLTEPTGYKTHASDDFFGYREDVVYDGSTTKPGFAGANIREAARQFGYTIDHVDEKLVRNDVKQYFSIYSPSLNTVTQYVTEFDITIDPNSTIAGGLFYKMNNSANSQLGFKLSRSNGGKLVATSAKTEALNNNSDGSFETVEVLPTFEMGRTYNIKLLVDFTKTWQQTVSGWTGDNAVYNKTYTRCGIISVYVDNVLCRDDLRFAYACGSAGADKVGFEGQLYGGYHFTVDENQNANFKYDIDNYSVYTDVRENVVDDAIVALKTAFPTGAFTGASTYTLPASTDAGYVLNWTSDNAAFDVETGAITYGDTAQDVTLAVSATDVAGKYTSDAVKIKFKIAPKYEVNSLAMTTAIDSVKFVNNGSENILLIAAVYQGDVLKGCKIINEGLATGVKALNLAKPAGDFDVKFFVWGTDGALAPFSLVDNN